jgi:hypothetical protein
MLRDPSQFAEKVEHKPTLSSFSSGLPPGAATKVPILLSTNPAADFIRQSVCHSPLWISPLKG